MPAYTSADLARIADALDVEPAVVNEYAERLDGARFFAEFHGKAMPMTPTATRDRLLKIAASARRLLEKLDGISRTGRSDSESGSAEPGQPLSAARLRRAIDTAEKNAKTLLRHLGVRDWREAADGPESEVVDVLACAEGTSHDSVVRLTAAIGDLPPLLAAARLCDASSPAPEIPAHFFAALEELERVAGDAADEVLHLGDLVVPKGHPGDLEVQGWIEDMGRLYVEVTGRRPTDWVIRNGRPSRFIRLLQAAGRPIGLDYSPEAWRRRVRDYLRQLPQPVQE